MAKQAVSRSIARISLIAGVALMALAGTAQAAAGDIVLRARVLQLDPAQQSTAIPSLSVPADAITVSEKKIWEIDASYFLANNWAVEVIATTPQKHEVKLGGTSIGTLRHLPPTVTAQYHFAPSNPTVRPYLGFGVNYTHFSAVNLNAGSVLGGSVPLELSSNHSWGTAVQLGADFPINEKLSINVDFKKIDIKAKVRVKGASQDLTTVKVNPVLFGIGVGYKF